MKIHICIVSEQSLANLIPVLMDRPDKIWLISSKEMTERKLDRRLKTILAQERIEAEIVSNAPANRLPDIHGFAINLAEKIDASHPGAELTLNITGGTKVMAMGIADALRSISTRVIYTDTSNRCIERLPDGTGSVHEPVPMTDVLDVPKYLAAQGFTTRQIGSDQTGWLEVVNKRKAAAKYIAQHAKSLGGLIGAINALANQALVQEPGTREQTLHSPRQDLRETPWGERAQALRELASKGLLGWQEGRKEIVFIDVEKTRFLHGGWLEEYAWHIVHDEKPFDVRMSVEVAREGMQHAENEFDVLATHGNQLLFIECKTARFNAEENDNELARKLDSLGKLARGVFGETWLLSAREPSPLLSEQSRANRIRLIGPEELPNLRRMVQDWMKGPS